MNRYAAEGILSDVRAGKSVAVLSEPHKVRESFHGVLGVAVSDSSFVVRRANGRERISHPSGGEVCFHPKRSGVRGHSLDVVYVEPGGLTDDLLEQIMPALLVRGGQLIRA